jgi:hypothetical protein
MWIPYGLLGPLKAESPPEATLASERDGEERDFLVGFFLRNPVTQAWEADILIESTDCKEGVPIGGRPSFVGFFPGKSGKLEEIIYRVRATAPGAALAACYAHVTGLLALWAVALGRGLDVAGYRVADAKHGGRWRCVPFRPSALPFESPDPSGLSPAHLALAGLYREARNATSARWRLFCALAILEAWSRRDGVFAATDRGLAGRGEARAAWVVTREMLLRGGALEVGGDLEGCAFPELTHILGLRRDEVTAALGAVGSAVPASDHATEVELAALANLADLAAHKVLVEEIELHRRLAGAPAETETGPPPDGRKGLQT